MCAIAAWKSVKTAKSSSLESDASRLTFSAVPKSEGRSDLVRPALGTVCLYRGCVLAILASRYNSPLVSTPLGLVIFASGGDQVGMLGQENVGQE